MPSVQRFFTVMAAATLIFAGVALARDVTIKLSSGQTVTGTLVSQTTESLTIRVNGADRTIPRNQMVGEPQFQLGLAEQYQQKRAQLADDNWAGRYMLAEEIYRGAEGLAAEAATKQQGIEAYQIALRELQSILQGNPDMAQAKLLRDLASKRLAEIKAPAGAPAPRPPGKNPQPRPAPGGAPVPGAAPAPGGAAPLAAGEAPRLLTDEEINLIKVYELRLDSDPRPRLMVPRDTIDKLLQDFRDDPRMQPYLGRDGEAKLRTMEGWEQVDLMFALKARDLYKDIIVRTEPQVLQDYRVRVHNNYLVNYCGRCHAEGKAAGLYVITKPGPAVPQVAYSNLMLLRRTQTKNNPLLFPERADQSMLLQYGLPPLDAVTPHPEVNLPGVKLRPYFSGPTDPKFLDMVAWVRAIAPEDYPIEYQAPGAPSAAEPVAVPPQVGGGPVPAPAPGKARPGKAAPGKAAPPRPAPKAGQR